MYFLGFPFIFLKVICCEFRIFQSAIYGNQLSNALIPKKTEKIDLIGVCKNFPGKYPAKMVTPSF